MACSAAGMEVESPNNILKLSKIHYSIIRWWVLMQNSVKRGLREPPATVILLGIGYLGLPDGIGPGIKTCWCLLLPWLGCLQSGRFVSPSFFFSPLQTVCSKVNVSGTFNILGLDSVCNKPCLSCTLPRLCYNLHEWWSEVKHPDQSVFCLSCAITVNQKVEVGI